MQLGPVDLALCVQRLEVGDVVVPLPVLHQYHSPGRHLAGVRHRHQMPVARMDVHDHRLGVDHIRLPQIGGVWLGHVAGLDDARQMRRARPQEIQLPVRAVIAPAVELGVDLADIVQVVAAATAQLDHRSCCQCANGLVEAPVVRVQRLHLIRELDAAVLGNLEVAGRQLGRVVLLEAQHLLGVGLVIGDPVEVVRVRGPGRQRRGLAAEQVLGQSFEHCVRTSGCFPGHAPQGLARVNRDPRIGVSSLPAMHYRGRSERPRAGIAGNRWD